MARPKEEFDAWVIGAHVLTQDAIEHSADARDGDVLVHNVTRDTWTLMSRSSFERMFEWA